MEITREIVRELLHYDPETGVFTWRERGGRRFKTERDRRRWNSRHAGARAGSMWTDQRTGYQCRYIKLLDQSYKEHQLAWLYMTDAPLPSEIDHKNRDGTDNRWANIRPSARSKNSRNRSMYRNNTSGVTGVTWHERSGKWRACCKVGGKAHSLGLFDELDEAAMAVMEFRAEHGFDPRHGREIAHYHR